MSAINIDQPPNQKIKVVLSAMMLKTNKWDVQSERKFLLTRKQIIIVNENTITRKMEYDDLRGISVLVNDGEQWPPKKDVEGMDAELLIHVN